MMDQQNIIIPNGSLMIVDRGWRRSNQLTAPVDGQTKSCFTRSFDDIAISVLKTPSTQNATSQSCVERSRPGIVRHALSGAPRNFAFVNSTGYSRNRDPEVQKAVRRRVVKRHGCDQQEGRTSREEAAGSLSLFDICDHTQNEIESSTKTCNSLKLGAVFPGSAISFYGVNPLLEKPQFYKLLNYCMLKADGIPALYALSNAADLKQMSLPWLIRYIP